MITKRILIVCALMSMFCAGLNCQVEYAQPQGPHSSTAFNYDAEYFRRSVLKDYGGSYLYNAGSVSMSGTGKEFVIQFSQFETSNAFTVILKKNISDSFYLGLGGSYRDRTYSYGSVDKTQALHAEIGNNLPIVNEGLNWRVFYEENLLNTNKCFFEFIDTQFNYGGKDLGLYEHWACFEMNMLKSDNPRAKVFTSKFPLTYLPRGSSYLYANLSYNGYTNAKTDSGYDDNRESAIQSKAAYYNKLTDKLELSTNAGLIQYDSKSATSEGSLGILNMEIGLTYDMLQTDDGFYILAKTAFRYTETKNKYEYDSDFKYTSKNSLYEPFIIPTLVMSYRVSEIISLNSTLSRLYYTRKKGTNADYYNDQNWDVALGLSVRYDCNYIRF